MRRFILAAAFLAVGCGGSASPTAPQSPTAPVVSPPPAPVDPKAACGLSNTHREGTSNLSWSGGEAQPKNLGGFAPRDRGGKWFVRLTWPAGQSMSFEVRAVGVEAGAYPNVLLGSSTPESATSATACVDAPAGVYVNVPSRWTNTGGTVTAKIDWSYPQ